MQLLKWSGTCQLTFIGKWSTEKNHELKSQIRTLWSKETLIILVESTWMQFTISLWPFKVWMQEALEIKTIEILSVHLWFPYRIRIDVSCHLFIYSPIHLSTNRTTSQSMTKYIFSRHITTVESVFYRLYFISISSFFLFFQCDALLTFMRFYVRQTNFNATLRFTIVNFQSLYVNEFSHQ